MKKRILKCTKTGLVFLNLWLGEEVPVHSRDLRKIYFIFIFGETCQLFRGGESGGRGGAAAPLKNFLCIRSILLINIVKCYLPLLTEATF